MSLVVNTNVSSLTEQRSRGESASMLNKATERLSSDIKINHVSDDTTGLAIVQRINAQINGLRMAIRKANDDISLTQSIEGALKEVSDMLQRLRELAVQATEDTKTETERAFLQAEVNLLIAEITRVFANTRYKGEKFLDDTLINKQLQEGRETIQGSTEPSSSKTFSIKQSGEKSGVVTDPDVGTESTTNDNYFVNQAAKLSDVSIIDLRNNEGRSKSIKLIDGAIEGIASMRSNLGTTESRLEHAVFNLLSNSEITTEDRLRVSDTDYLIESAKLTKTQLLQEPGTAMLAQANADSELVVQLLR